MIPLSDGRIRKIACREGRQPQAIFKQWFSVKNQPTSSGSSSHIIFNDNARTLQPEAITSMAKIPVFLSTDWLITGAMHSNRKIALKTTNLISRLCTESSTHHIEGNIVDEIDITGMVNKPPAWIARHHTSANDSGRATPLNTVAMKMNGIAPPSISTRFFHKESFIIEIWTIQGSKLVSAAKIIEGSIRHIHFSRMHEHHVTATINGCVLRRELHIAADIGHMNLQVIPRRDVVLA